MRKVFKCFLSILLLIFIFSLDTNEVNSANQYLIDSGGNYNFDYSSNLNGSYYSSLNGLTGEDFRDELHLIISSGDINRKSYDACKELLKEIDEDLNNSNNILCILTGKSMPKSTFGENGKNGWNREHIWPKSHGFNNDNLFAYSDLHHLRAAEAYTNSTFHNDYDYGVVSSNCVEDAYGNKYISPDKNSGYGIYEPRDSVKGDIARMIMYMDIRYEGDSLSDNIQLSIVNGGTNVSSDIGYLGDLDTLISWHENDPVDDLERKRNDIVFNVQGNRNPFIDHPEYANIIYDANYDVLEENEYRVLYYVDNGEFTYVDLNHYNADDKINMPNETPVSNRYDFKFLNWTLSNGEVFDFSNDTINSNIKLYANWVYSPLPVTDMFKRGNTLTGLHLSYQMTEIEEKPIIQTTTVTVVGDGPLGKNVSKNTSFDYDEYLDYNKNDIKVTYAVPLLLDSYVTLISFLL